MKSCATPLAGLTLAPVIDTVGVRLVRSAPNGTVSEMFAPLMVASTPRMVSWVMSFAELGATLTVTVYALAVRSSAVTT